MAKSQEEVDEIIKQLKKKNHPNEQELINQSIIDGITEGLGLQPFTKQLEFQKTIANATSKAFEGLIPKVQSSLDILIPIIEEATKYHRLWLEELAKKSDDEIRKSIHDSLNVDEILEQEIDKTLSPEIQEKQKELVLLNIKELEEDYFQEVMEIRNKLHQLTTEEEKELQLQLDNIQNPSYTAFLKNRNVTNLFSLKEEKKPGEQFALANSDIRKEMIEDEEGNYQIQEVADFIIQYIFENGLQKGELTLKERLIFHNLIYYTFCFNEINKKVIHGTRKIPTIIPIDTIARMIRGNETKRIEANDKKLVDKVMDKFDKMRTFIDYEDLKARYKERFEEELELDEFELVGTGEFASFVESELHKGINWKKEFEKYGIEIVDDGKEFDGYIITKIPVFNAIKIQKQIGFIPYSTNGYLSMTETGIAINFEFQNLITSLDTFTNKKFAKINDGSFGKIPISNKFDGKNPESWKKNAIPEEEWELHKNDQKWKNNHFGFYLYYIEERIDTFFKHCFDSINTPKDQEAFGRYNDNGQFIASGSESVKNDPKERRKRSLQIGKMESYLLQAKKDRIIFDFELIQDESSPQRNKPIYKVRILKKKGMKNKLISQ